MNANNASRLIGRWEGRPEDKAAIDALADKRRAFHAADLATKSQKAKPFDEVTDDQFEEAIRTTGAVAARLADHFGVKLSKIYRRCEELGISLRDRRFLLWADISGI
jgi:transposase